MKFSQHGEIEDAILSTFLFAHDYDFDTSKAFKLDLTAFSNKYRQSVAERINNTENHQYNYLLTIIEEKSMGTAYEQDYINMIAQTQLSFGTAKKYHDELLKRNKMKGAV